MYQLPNNPADIITRGCRAETLSENNLWWHGPEWLSQAECNWPSSNVVLPSEIPEHRIIHSILVVNSKQNSSLLIDIPHGQG